MNVLVWDLPTRLFHWLLTLAVAGALTTGIVGGNWIEWHGRLGLLIVGLLGFRLIWGLLGSTYARFGSFFPTPGRLRAYLRGDWYGLGHNPLGALSVFALLGLLAWQAGSGLFSNDDIAFTGPLYPLIAKADSDWLSSWHRQGLWWLGGLIALHIGAILFYRLVRGKDLIGPMLTGRAPAPGGDGATTGAAAAARGGRWPALLVALLLAAALVWLAAGGALPPPPPPPPPPAW